MNSKFSGLRGLQRGLLGCLLTAGALALPGCYVVPAHHPASYPAQPLPSAAPAAPVSFTARLYPSNDLASGYGVISAVVTNDLHGRGTFNTSINGEAFSGEATRKAGSSKEGLASGAGQRGSYIHCTYTMNTATQGMGNCLMSNGARFTMHVGQ